jgi:hypothetical protein
MSRDNENGSRAVSKVTIQNVQQQNGYFIISSSQTERRRHVYQKSEALHILLQKILEVDDLNPNVRKAAKFYETLRLAFKRPQTMTIDCMSKCKRAFDVAMALAQREIRMGPNSIGAPVWIIERLCYCLRVMQNTLESVKFGRGNPHETFTLDISINGLNIHLQQNK